MRKYTPETFLVAFWSKVDCTAGLFECWIWTACLDGSGYGSIRFHGPMRKAHRISYELAFGPIPDNLHVLHKCDNPPSVNPSHLFLGTDLDNCRDRERKGRGKQPCGEHSGRHKLTDVQIEEIRRLYDTGSAGLLALSKAFGVSDTHIWRIVTYKNR